MQYQRVSSLSGGELRRLYLLRVLMTAPNVLILDEPTNDLDLETLGVLEDYLDSFQGAVIAVSHDRYFLDRVTTHLFAIEHGEMKPYIGGYQSYLDAHQPDASNRPKSPKTTKKPTDGRNRPVSALKFTFKEQYDFERIDQTIETLETKLSMLNDELERNASDYTRAAELMQQQAEAQQALDQAMEYWLYLQDKYEQIQSAKEASKG